MTTADSKRAILAAFDGLNGVASAVTIHGRRSGHLSCAVCGSPIDEHQTQPNCPIWRALCELEPLLPRFEEREAWIASNEFPVRR